MLFSLPYSWSGSSFRTNKDIPRAHIPRELFLEITVFLNKQSHSSSLYNFNSFVCRIDNEADFRVLGFYEITSPSILRIIFCQPYSISRIMYLITITLSTHLLQSRVSESNRYYLIIVFYVLLAPYLISMLILQPTWTYPPINVSLIKHAYSTN